MTLKPGILSDRAIGALFGGGQLKSEVMLDKDQIQPASLDLRLGSMETTAAVRLPELLAALNRLQGDYWFSLVPTSATRRYRDLESGRFDLILFESPGWGWQGRWTPSRRPPPARAAVARSKASMLTALFPHVL